MRTAQRCCRCCTPHVQPNRVLTVAYQPNRAPGTDKQVTQRLQTLHDLLHLPPPRPHLHTCVPGVPGPAVPVCASQCRLCCYSHVPPHWSLTITHRTRQRPPAARRQLAVHTSNSRTQPQLAMAVHCCLPSMRRCSSSSRFIACGTHTSGPHMCRDKSACFAAAVSAPHSHARDGKHRTHQQLRTDTFCAKYTSTWFAHRNLSPQNPCMMYLPSVQALQLFQPPHDLLHPHLPTGPHPRHHFCCFVR